MKIPVYWGNRNWDPYLRDALRADEGRRRLPRRRAAHQRLLLLQRVPAVPRGPRRRGRAAVPGAAAGRPAARLLQPPRLRRADGRRHAGGARRPAGGGAPRRPPGLRHPLDPGGDERRAAVRAVAPTCAQHRVRRRRDRRARSREETGHRYPSELVFCSRSGSAAGAVARARRQRPPPGAAPPGRPGRRGGADRLRLRPHGGRLRPRHRGAGRPPRSSVCPTCGRRPPGSTRASWRWSATCCSSAAPSSAARPVERASVGLGAGLGRVRRRVLPQPARAAPGAVRPGLSVPDDDLDAPSRPARRSPLALPPGRPAELGVPRMRDRGVEVAGTKSSPTDVVTEADQACEELIRERLLGARPDGRVHRRGGARRARAPRGVRWIVDPIDGTVNYLYGLPHYAVSIAAARDGRGGRRSRAWPPPSALEYAATLGGGATRNGVPLDGRAAPAARPRRWWAPGSATSATIRAHQAEAVARMLPQVRDIRRIGSCALDLCAVAAGSLDAYVEEGPHALGPRRGRPGRDRVRRPDRGLGDPSRQGPRGVRARPLWARFGASGRRLRLPLNKPAPNREQRSTVHAFLGSRKHAEPRSRSPRRYRAGARRVCKFSSD